jgi:hypothetical protein
LYEVARPSPLPVYVTVEPEFKVGAVVVSEPNHWKVPPFWIVNAPPQVKLYPWISKVPDATVQVAVVPVRLVVS